MIRNFAEMPFYKGATIAGLLFFVVVAVFKFVYALYSGEAIADITAKMATTDFLISNIVGAVVYGVVITFYYKWRAKKYQK